MNAEHAVELVRQTAVIVAAYYSVDRQSPGDVSYLIDQVYEKLKENYLKACATPYQSE